MSTNSATTNGTFPGLRELLEDILPRDKCFDAYEVEHEFPKIGKKKMLLNGRKIEQQSGNKELILLAIEDVTDNITESKHNRERTGP